NNPEKKVGGKTMKEILRFSVAYWHTFTEELSDPFGVGTAVRSWDKYTGIYLAKARVEAAFEFIEKLNARYFLFNTVDITPEVNNLINTNKNLDSIVTMI